MLIPLWLVITLAIFLIAAGFTWGYREGREDGFKEGYQAGYDDGELEAYAADARELEGFTSHLFGFGF